VWLLDEKEILIQNAHEKLEAAKYLYRKGFYGDAVSRAYYSMFLQQKRCYQLEIFIQKLTEA